LNCLINKKKSNQFVKTILTLHSGNYGIIAIEIGDLSEETQIGGNFGIKRTFGTFKMLLNLEDLSKLNIEL
jgi:hypothetical protein